MRAVTGSVVSSAPVSLKRAAAIISNFVVADSGARPEIAVYSSRASRAFNELLELHREIRSSRGGGGGENDELSQHREERHRRRKRKEIDVFDRIEQHGVRINHTPRLDNSMAEMDVRMEKIKERSGVDEEGSSRVGGVEKKMKKEGSSSWKEAEGMEMNLKAELSEREEKHKEEEFGEKGSSAERRRKKKDAKRNGEEDVNVEGGDKSGKKRKHLDAGNGESGLGGRREGHQKSGEFGDQSERHHKKKRRKEV